MGIWRHLRAIVPLPTMVTLVIPSVIIYRTGAVHVGWGLSIPFKLLPPLLGCGLIVLGLFLLVRTVSLFAVVGQGTLAPWDPTRRLVVQGVYRHVRNPMISSVLFILLGEATLLGSVPLLEWFLFFFLLNAVYIPLIEEPGLVQRFGEEYLRYKAHVPRWIPRLRPWNPLFSSTDNARRPSESTR